MSIPKVQIAAVVPGPGAPIEIREDYPVKQADDLAPGECLIKMHCSGVCHTGTQTDDLTVPDPEQTSSSRLTRQKGRLAYLRCHVRIRRTVIGRYVLTFPQSSHRWPRRCR